MTEKEKNAYQKYIKSLNNRSILELVIDDATGDDYDGCFTRDGSKKFEMLRSELYFRLGDWLYR